MKSFGLSKANFFHFHGLFKIKRAKISTPTRNFIHMNPLSRNPGSVTVVLAACSHVYLLACMQQCACLSGGARSIFVWTSVYRFSLCALGQTMGPRCVRAANALITVYLHMLVRVVDVRILVGMHVLQIVQANS